jgi:hypothetical protein
LIWAGASKARTANWTARGHGILLFFESFENAIIILYAWLLLGLQASLFFHVSHRAPLLSLPKIVVALVIEVAKLSIVFSCRGFVFQSWQVGAGIRSWSKRMGQIYPRGLCIIGGRECGDGFIIGGKPYFLLFFILRLERF